MAGYLIASIAFALAFCLGATGARRPRAVLLLGAVFGVAWLGLAAANRQEDVDKGYDVLPFWLLIGLVLLLYLIWCGGLWLGLRLRRARAR